MNTTDEAKPDTSFTGYALPPLRYGYDALEPFIDTETMHLHHDKHHQAYIDKVNAAIAPYPQFHNMIIEDLMRKLDEVPAEIRTVVRNNGGGHANHQFFWKVIGPARGTQPTGRLAEGLKQDFGSLESFQAKFTGEALKLFGSGWTFLVINPQTHKLEILCLAQSRQCAASQAPRSTGLRRLGTRLLSEVPESPRRLPESVVERGGLGRSQ